jgi:hypothetical protein
VSIIRPVAVGLVRAASVVGADHFSPDTLGPELVNFASQTWGIGLQGGAAGTVTQDASGIHFAAANNSANAFLTVTAGLLADNGTYLVSYTLSGSAVHGLCRLYGQTNNHLGGGTTHNVAGSFSETTVLNTTTTAFLNRIHFLCTGSNGGNTFDVTNLSVRRVLG